MEKQIRQYWDKKAKKYGECPWATGWGGHLRNIEVKEVKKRVPKKGFILDLGCGNGYVLQKIVSPNRNLVGIDLSRSMVKIAKKRLGRNSEIILAEAVNMPFKDNSFDFIYTIRTLIFVPRDKKEKGIIETTRILKPNHLLMLIECCEEGIKNLNIFRQRFGIAKPLSAHGLFFKKETIETTLNRNNIETIKQTYFPTVSILEKVLYPKIQHIRGATRFFSILYLLFYRVDSFACKLFPVLGFDVLYVGRKKQVSNE